ncbi:MAG: 2-dehydro-3-deoxygalactonokinase [Dokdonella sp.]
MKPLLAIDWGTSSLRGALLRPDGRTIGEREFAHGVLNVEAGGFAQAFDSLFGDWMREARLCLMAGMVGSRQGWREVPYCACPATLAEISANLEWLQPGLMAIVPGLSCRYRGLDGDPVLAELHDVMRGEETQVLGALRLLGLADATLVLPGTHSKWVQVRTGRIKSFTTFMTGEFFALLRCHSILARTIPEAADEGDDAAFELGVRLALQGTSLLATAFSARTVALFDQVDARSRSDYLSGLVIGEELRAQPMRDSAVIVIGSDALTRRYSAALAIRGVAARCVGAEATWAGLAAVAQSLAA